MNLKKVGNTSFYLEMKTETPMKNPYSFEDVHDEKGRTKMIIQMNNGSNEAAETIAVKASYHHYLAAHNAYVIADNPAAREWIRPSL